MTAGSSKKAAPGRPFQKGQSGNPSGRAKIPEDVKEAARAHTEEAIRTLAEIMGDSAAQPGARVRAAESLLNRAWGSPESTTTVNVNKNVRDLSTAEILAALAASGVVGAEAGADGAGAVH
jgi:hypothetical protein